MTNKTKPQTHTPGPWVAENGRILGNDGGMGALVAIQQTPVKGMKPEEYEANARLIAAAPDLLAEVLKALGYLGRIEEGSEGAELRDSLRAAIARATGAK